MWYNTRCATAKEGLYCSDGDNIVHENKELSWLDAQETCTKNGMVLSTVTQSNHHKFTKSGWIGLHSPNTSGRDTSKDIWKWIGEDSDFRKWAPGTPYYENCGYLSTVTGKWRSATCTGLGPFICFTDNLILVKENKTWEEALEHCRAIGSDDPSQYNHYRDHQYDLVSLQSEDDHRYARDKLQDASTNEV